MNGFREELIGKIIGINAHISVFPKEESAYIYDDLIKLIVDDDVKYWNHTIEYINELIRLYKESNNNEEKTNLLRRAKQALPAGYIQKRTITMNYENIWTIYNQRKNHRLKEWSTDFVNWAESLPYFHELFLDGDTNA